MGISDIQPLIWEMLVRSISNNRIANAYLFQGPQGCGKEWAAIEFARSLNCLQKEKSSCYSCESCIKFSTLQHPDLSITVPLPSIKNHSKESNVIDSLTKDDYELLINSINKKSKDPFFKIKIPKSQRILINSIRDIKKKIYLKSDSNYIKVFIIFDAHLLSIGGGESANALLKILEEPPNNSVFILSTDYGHKLLPTIISRCQSLNFSKIQLENAEKLLINMGLKKSSAHEIASFSDGNMHFANRLIGYSVDSLIGKSEKFVYQITKLSNNSWKSFIDDFSILAYRKPDEFYLNFYLIQIWFYYAYRIRNGVSLASSAMGVFEKKIKEFNSRYPNANFSEINIEIEKVIISLSQNLNINLMLVNFLISIQTLLKGKELREVV